MTLELTHDLTTHLSPSQAVAYLTESRESLLASGISAETLDAAVAAIPAAAAMPLTEQAAAAEMTTMSREDAMAYLADPVHTRRELEWAALP